MMIRTDIHLPHLASLIVSPSTRRRAAVNLPILSLPSTVDLTR